MLTCLKLFVCSAFFPTPFLIFEILQIMSFISNLTWSCIEIQSVIENPDVSEAEKDAVVLKHLSSLEECNREVFPEFESGES